MKPPPKRILRHDRPHLGFWTWICMVLFVAFFFLAQVAVSHDHEPGYFAYIVSPDRDLTGWVCIYQEEEFPCEFFPTLLDCQAAHAKYEPFVFCVKEGSLNEKGYPA